MNLLSNLEQIAKLIIRPSRYIYKIVDLGPKILQINNKIIKRYDFQVKNLRGYNLKASIFTEHQNFSKIQDVMIYLHCNSGCKIQGLSYLNLAVSNDFAYVVFDFCGSGNSQGKYISLGFYQVDDLTAIIKYLQQKISEQIKIVLWGRSMGAVTVLRYLQRNNNIKLVILDSPFLSLKKLFLQIGKQKSNLPKLLLQVAYKYLKPIVYDKALFNIDDVTLQQGKYINNCPAIFIASKNDFLIPFEHIDQIFKSYKGQKQMFFVEESHNQARNMVVIAKVFKATIKLFKNLEQAKLNYYSYLPRKKQDLSRQKLQLTIKSNSQRVLITKDSILPLTPNKNETQCIHQVKKPKCGLFIRKSMQKLPNKKQRSQNSQMNIQSIYTRRKPISIKKFFNEEIQNENLIKFKNKNLNEDIFLQKMTIKNMDKTNKYMQNVSKKRPPFKQLKSPNEFKNSFKSKNKK